MPNTLTAPSVRLEKSHIQIPKAKKHPYRSCSTSEYATICQPRWDLWALGTKLTEIRNAPEIVVNAHATCVRQSNRLLSRRKKMIA
jgi:hypothetical protein